MSDLTTPQLDSIRRLLLDPLREAVRAEVELGHDRLRQTIEQLADQVAAHAQSQSQRDTESTRRLAALEAQATRNSAFQSRVLVVYGFIAMGLSLLWSIVRDRLIARITGRGM